MPSRTQIFSLVANSDWTQISDGSTPVSVRISGSAEVAVMVSATQPATNEAGQVLHNADRDFNSTTSTPVWARSLRSASDVYVTPQAASGSGGATMIPDGADVTDGARSDAAWDGAAASASIVSILKACWGRLAAIANALGQALPLPTGAATAARQDALLTALASALPLPTGAATAAKQDASAAKLDQLHADMIAATPAGANVIGKVGIDQTTPGTTNKVLIGSTASATDGTVSGSASGASIAAGGTGYAVGNTVTLTDGTVLTVSTVSSGVITAVSLTTAGTVTALPSGATSQASTSGSGSGATFNMSYTPIATQLFGGATPANGWKVANPDPVSDLWVNDNGTPAVNDGFRVFAAGGQYATEPGEKPVGIVRIIGSVVGQKFKARAW